MGLVQTEAAVGTPHIFREAATKGVGVLHCLVASANQPGSGC